MIIENKQAIETLKTIKAQKLLPSDLDPIMLNSISGKETCMLHILRHTHIHRERYITMQQI